MMIAPFPSKVIEIDEGASYDFEDDIRESLPQPFLAADVGGVGQSTLNSYSRYESRQDGRFRTQVCSYWLIGLCQKGGECGHLHQLVKSKCPPCTRGKSCRIKNCLLQHSVDEGLTECLFFKQGFCMNGPSCKFKHKLKGPDECPEKANFDETVATLSAAKGIAGGRGLKRPMIIEPGQNFRITLCRRWLEAGVNGKPPCQFVNDCNFAHGEEDLRPLPGADIVDDDHIYDPTKGQMSSDVKLPFSGSANVAYFLAHAPNLRSLAVSKHLGIWRLPAPAVYELNNLLTKVDEVALFFCVDDLLGFYGVAIVKTQITINPMSPISEEFPVNWVHTFRCSFRVVGHMKTSDGALIGKTAYDILLDKDVGFDLALIFFRKPSWHWYTNLHEAQDMNTLSPETLALPPTALFASDWMIERALNICADSGMFSDMQESVEDFLYQGNESGFIFGVYQHQLDECFSRGLFGAAMLMKEAVLSTVRPGSPLFLLDTTNNTLHGVFQAISEIGEHLEPGAFLKGRGGSAECAYPLQVRVTCTIGPAPFPDSEPEIRKILGARGTKVGPLTLLETKKLVNFFAFSCGAMMTPEQQMFGVYPFPPVPQNPFMMAPHQQMQQPSQQGYYRPPFKFTEVIPVNIPFSGDGFHFRKRLLGNGAAKVHQIIDEIANNNTLRIRLRGIGSGYMEGPSKSELLEPLHFNISAEDPNILLLAIQRVQQLIQVAL